MTSLYARSRSRVAVEGDTAIPHAHCSVTHTAKIAAQVAANEAQDPSSCSSITQRGSGHNQFPLFLRDGYLIASFLELLFQHARHALPGVGLNGAHVRITELRHQGPGLRVFGRGRRNRIQVVSGLSNITQFQALRL